jgi:hypothetical protein
MHGLLGGDDGVGVAEKPKNERATIDHSRSFWEIKLIESDLPERKALI